MIIRFTAFMGTVVLGTAFLGLNLIHQREWDFIPISDFEAVKNDVTLGRRILRRRVFSIEIVG